MRAAFARLAFLASASFALLVIQARAQVYPSSGAFWVGGSCTDDSCNPTDPQTQQDGLRTWQDVVRWEATHGDFSAWGGLEYRPYVPSMTVLDYIYVGALNADGLFVWETDLRKLATTNLHNFEDFFLHYSQDTWLYMTELYENDTAWAGVPPAIGYSLSGSDQTGVVLPGTGPWTADIFQGVSQGGSFYLADPEKFGEATFTFQSGGAPGTGISIQYASAVSTDGNFTVTQWKPLLLTPTGDGTRGFTRSGRISFKPPSDWVWGYNQIPQGLEFSRRGYAHWLKITGSGRPILSNLTTRAWVGPDPSNDNYLKVPGWDARNDVNGDGYVDDNEYAHLVNPGATARFRYESRVAMLLDNGWFWHNSSFSGTNTANPQYQQDVAQYYQGHWQSPLVNGAYNDNFWIDLNPWVFPVQTGGQLIPEGSIQGTVPSDETDLAYSTAFDQVLKGVKQSTGSHWMGTNISNVNPYDFHGWCFPYPSKSQAMLDSGAFDWFILESTLYDDWTMVDIEDYFAGPGISRIWQIPAFAKAGLKSAIMTRVGTDLLPPPPFDLSSQPKWERSQTALLAEYYLFHFTGLTSFQSIYTNITDISQLTTTADYYKAGVPSNYAYQPRGLMRVDIGAPAGVIPPSYQPMPYTAAVDETGQRNNWIVGDTTSTSLSHPVYGSIPVLPTNTYYLYTSSTGSGPCTTVLDDPQYHQPFPAEAVLARQYTKGMVVYRTCFTYPVGHDYQGYASGANQITVTLPGLYQKVNYDGSLAPASNQVTLHGFEGAVLVGWTVPVITSQLSVNATVGSPFQYQITATDNPTHFGTTPLPIGLQINAATGLISGTPRTVGLFRVGLSATNQYATGTDTLWINVTP